MVASLFTGCFGSADAAERKLFENVKGWEVERVIGQQGPNVCQMSYGYKDKNDGNAANAIIVMLNGEKLTLVLGYEKWGWDKDEKVQASVAIDKQVLYSKQGWTGDGQILKTQLPGSVAPRLSKGRQIVLKFDNGAADFSIPGFADAFDGLKRCDAAALAPVAQTAVPNQIRIQAYMMGYFLQRTAANCEVNTTGKQRAALDEKIAALRPEMAPVEAGIQEELRKAGSAPGCPPEPKDKASFETELNSYIALSPEDYAAAAERRSGERKAAADAKAKADTEAVMRAQIEKDMREKAEVEARIRAEVEAKLRAEAEARNSAAQAPKP